MSITNNLGDSLTQKMHTPAVPAGVCYTAPSVQDFESDDTTSSIWDIQVDVLRNVRDLTSCLEYLKGPVNKDALIIKTRFLGDDSEEAYRICEALINSGRFDLNKKFQDSYSTFNALKNACNSLNKPLVELFLSRGDINSHLASGCLTKVLNKPADSPEKVSDKYAIAQLLWDKLRVDQVKSRYEKYHKILDWFGIQGDTFLKEIAYEMTRVLTAKSGVPFDRDFLRRMSETYQNFWADLDNGEPINRDRFEKALANFPYKTASINFLPQMFEVYLAMQEVERLRGFPVSELWRFAIDAHKQEMGCCAFESEPGYLKGFLQGMLYAIQTRKQPKTAAWYIELHKRIINGVLTVQGEEINTSGSILYTNFRSMNTEVRTGDVAYSADLDQDPMGIEDLKTRSGAQSYTFDPHSKRVEYSNSKDNETSSRNDLVFDRFNQLLPTMTGRAQKLLLFLWTARELELEHIFDDANGRGSHLDFLSMLLGEDDLPPFLFPNANVLDANGPESLVYRYLEGCVNFQRRGIGHAFRKEESVKKLGSLKLEDKELIALREELRPYVEDKSWKDLRETLFITPS